MEAIREIRTALTNEVTMSLPDEFINEDIEITIKKIGKDKGKKEKSDFNAFRLNTRGFVFDREEANER